MASESTERCCLLRTIGAATRRHAAAAMRFDHEVGAKAGLTLSSCEAQFVNLLRLHGPLSPGQLGRLAGYTSSGTITGVLDRLERAGYVSRTRSTTDRRKVSVSLNQDWLEDEDAPRARRLADVVTGFTDDQLATVAEFLTRLADAEARADTRLAAG
ncbi:MarR family winged helix-turn-helix transcriptional regulator [Pseudonocardia acaciae]|uniref:MarR family winged helix-turn-helix transcriptional regulator n=1 Tax=Pseudonocardia acaciae TaxID=551276 RepID=UPI000686F632|nr:MarR family transcriptional regulator [Pseudonocardia acaciae]